MSRGWCEKGTAPSQDRKETANEELRLPPGSWVDREGLPPRDVGRRTNYGTYFPPQGEPSTASMSPIKFEVVGCWYVSFRGVTGRPTSKVELYRYTLYLPSLPYLPYLAVFAMPCICGVLYLKTFL